MNEMKKSRFKKLVKEACKDTALNYLNSEIKKRNLKKLQKIKYTKLETQDYLLSNKLSIRQKKIIFKARTGMLNVGYNFGQHIKCFMCKLEDDNESHLFKCIMLKMSCPEIIEHSKLSFNLVFSQDMTQVANISNILIKVMRSREVFKNEFC